MRKFITLSTVIIAFCSCLNVHAQSNNPSGTNTTPDPNGNTNPVHQNPSDPTKSGTNEQLQQKFNTDGTGYENLTPNNIMDSQSSGTGPMLPDKKDSTTSGSSQNQPKSSKKTTKH